MGSTLGTVLAGIGIAFAAGAVLLLMQATGMGSGAPKTQFMMGGTAALVIGFFAFGYGISRRASY